MCGIMCWRSCFAALTEERHEPQTEHVERRHKGGDDADEPEHDVEFGSSDGSKGFAGIRLPKDLVLGEESRERWYAGDGDGADRHGAEGPGNQFAKSAHVAHVLFAGKSMDHRAGGEEQKRLEEGVRHQVEDAGGVRAYTGSQEHVAELRDGGIREDAFDVG